LADGKAFAVCQQTAHTPAQSMPAKADLPSAGGRQRGKPLCRLPADGKDFQMTSADVSDQLGQCSPVSGLTALFAVCWQTAKRPNRPAQIAQAAATWPFAVC